MSSSFEALHIWHDARRLVAQIYHVTTAQALVADFAFRDQMRRAALSVMSNIAEGHERGNDNEFLYFLRIAKASCGEVRSQLYAAQDVGYLPAAEAAALRGDAAVLSRRIEAFAKGRRATTRAELRPSAKR